MADDRQDPIPTQQQQANPYVYDVWKYNSYLRGFPPQLSFLVTMLFNTDEPGSGKLKVLYCCQVSQDGPMIVVALDFRLKLKMKWYVVSLVGCKFDRTKDTERVDIPAPITWLLGITAFKLFVISQPSVLHNNGLMKYLMFRHPLSAR